MSQVKYGDEIKVHYTCKLRNGEVLDSSKNSEPVQLKIGEGGIIPGLEKALIGMNQGESKTAEKSAKEAYGPHKKELVVEVDRDNLPENLDPQVGQKLEIQQANGQKIPVSVVDISQSSIKLDANHPLAGKDLVFDINIVEII